MKRAKGLNVKGKNGNNCCCCYFDLLLCIAGTNDSFVTIGLGREKFQTSVQEKTEDPEWCEQCEL